MCHTFLADFLEKLERNYELANHWFEDNNMKLNTYKRRLLFYGHKDEYQWDQLDRDKDLEENEVKLLGVARDCELNFDSHISNIKLKVNNKLSVLCRLKDVLTFQQRRKHFKSFFEA